jgi:trehalose 6-phosphate synthase
MGVIRWISEASQVSVTQCLQSKEALYKALTLSPEERRQKAELARQSVEHHDLKTWIAQQVRDFSSLIENGMTRYRSS